MAKKEFMFKGKTLEELKAMGFKELAELLNARQRRNIKRGFNDQHKVVLEKVKAGDKNLKTHCRDLIVLPSMVGMTIKIHNGKEFVPLIVQEDMIGHYLGEFAMSRKKVGHNAPGIGATKSSSSMSVK